MKKYMQLSVISPTIEFEIGGKVVESTMISNVSLNPNFLEPVLFLEVVRQKSVCFFVCLHVCLLVGLKSYDLFADELWKAS